MSTKHETGVELSPVTLLLQQAGNAVAVRPNALEIEEGHFVVGIVPDEDRTTGHQGLGGRLIQARNAGNRLLEVVTKFPAWVNQGEEETITRASGLELPVYSLVIGGTLSQARQRRLRVPYIRFVLNTVATNDGVAVCSNDNVETVLNYSTYELEGRSHGSSCVYEEALPGGRPIATAEHDILARLVR